MLRRTDKNPISEWWWTVDRLLFALVLTLIFIGIVLSLAASPPVAERLGLSSFHFVIRHLIFVVPALCVLVVTSVLKPEHLRRLALLAFIGALILTALTLFIGLEAKGATRWLHVGPFSIQPSEILKPSLIVIAAWLFAEGGRRPDMPGHLLACLILLPAVGLLVLQPDFGQTMLIVATWGALFFMAGMSWLWIAVFGILGAGGLVLAYQMLPHVTQRIDRFLDPSSGDTFQTDRAIDSFRNGGWFGTGPGEGTVKHILPDSHTDFIFAVAGEEYGALFGLLIVAMFALLVIRGLARAYREEDAFVRYATAGLSILIGLQATINLCVNLSLLPAKGMTLPFISYGGSSLISAAFTMGMILSLTRRRPQTVALKSTPRELILAEDAPA
ncbi:MAG: putative lipid II flippase FtsW [Pseudomonadota bacterium]